MYRSLFTGLAFFLPLPVLGTSVQTSFTFSRTMLQCRSNALTRANSLWLFRTLISTCEFVRMLCNKRERGPVANSSSAPPSLSSIADMVSPLAEPLRRGLTAASRAARGGRCARRRLAAARTARRRAARARAARGARRRGGRAGAVLHRR